ncbi:hypothetical protein NDN08_007774 [Rhodosorus marinus]|uniref:C2H2-type domain-containing protein n=1 Tax=Rhodosorus marinus TaxID=101924 RepID=A0AAV8UYI4_9RHOD|nr:hypothetical protein NDN08_007774 [Rhodosorus marinus]
MEFYKDVLNFGLGQSTASANPDTLVDVGMMMLDLGSPMHPTADGRQAPRTAVNNWSDLDIHLYSSLGATPTAREKEQNDFNQMLELELVTKALLDDSAKGKRAYKGATCPVCMKQFFRKYEMTRHHKATHLQLKPFKCSACVKSFARKSHLGLHWNNIHRRDLGPLQKFSRE